jgi:hypothetical protein
MDSRKIKGREPTMRSLPLVRRPAIHTAWRSPVSLGLLGLVAIGLVAFDRRASWAYTPESPEVKAMVDRGIQYLRTDKRSGSIGETGQMGTEVLKAYAIVKAGYDVADAKVVEGVNLAADFGNRCGGGYPYGGKVQYEAGVAVLLLLEVDPLKYRPQINNIAKAMFASQKPHGGFGYPQMDTGDTSQVQYCMLAMWSLHQNGFDVPPKAVEALEKWLLATQDPEGGWGYQGAPSNGGLIKQTRVNHGLTYAGIGSLIMGADILGIFGNKGRKRDPEDEDLPPALVRVVANQAKREAKTNLKEEDLTPSLNLSQSYLMRTPFVRNGPMDWYYYMMYGQERAQSFLELARGKQEKEPAWYNQGVEELKKLQDPATGAWGKLDQQQESLEPNVNTALAVLFLIRSTKKSIGELFEGEQKGGYGLPKDVSDARLNGSQVVGSPAAGTIDELLAMMEGQDADKLDQRFLPDDLKLDSDPEKRRAQLERLSLMTRSEAWQNRRIATKLLGQSGAMEMVPTLIAALTDSDASVRRYASDGLRFISRRFDGFPLPEETAENKPKPEELYAVQEAWKKWYLTIFPNYVFLDERR